MFLFLPCFVDVIGSNAWMIDPLSERCGVDHWTTTISAVFLPEEEGQRIGIFLRRNRFGARAYVDVAEPPGVRIAVFLAHSRAFDRC